MTAGATGDCRWCFATAEQCQPWRDAENGSACCRSCEHKAGRRATPVRTGEPNEVAVRSAEPGRKQLSHDRCLVDIVDAHGRAFCAHGHRVVEGDGPVIESRKCPGREATAPSDSDRTGARLSKGHQTGPTEPACEQPHAGDVWEMRPHSATDCTGREAEPLAAYRAQQKADKATRHATYKEREARLVSAMREATGLPFTGLDAVGGMWISLDAAEDYLSPPAKGMTPEDVS